MDNYDLIHEFLSKNNHVSCILGKYKCGLFKQCHPTKNVLYNIDNGHSSMPVLSLEFSNGTLCVHKCILIAGSHYFRSMLSSTFKEKSSQLITLENFTIEDFSVAAWYLYSNEACLTAENMGSVLSLSDYFGMFPLVTICCAFIQDHLDVQNCVSVMTTCNHLGKRDTYNTALHFASKHAAEVLSHPVLLQDAPFIVLKDFFKHHSIRKTSEVLDLCTDAVMLWAGQNVVRLKSLTTILSSFEIAALLHKYPSVSSHLCFPADYWKENERKQWQEFWLNPYLTTREVVVALGGEINAAGHLSQGIEFFNQESWKHHLTLPKCEIPLQFKNKYIENELLNAVSPTTSHNYNNVLDNRLKDLLDFLYKEKQMMVEKLNQLPDYYNGQLKSFTRQVIWEGLEKRKDSAVVTLTGRNSFVVVGGMNEEGLLDSVQEFGPGFAPVRSLPHLPVATAGGAAAAIDDMIYYVGGMTHEGVSGTLWALPLNDSVGWIRLCPMPVASVQLAASSLHGSLYAIGGYSSTQFSQDSCLSSCWRYEPFLNEWKEVEDMKAPRAELGCVTLKGQVYAIGGCDGLYSLSSVEKYCPSLNTWTEVASLQQHRKNFGCCVFDDRILVLGGSVYGKLSYSVEKYSPSTNSWHYAPSLVSERQCCNAAVITVPCWDESTQTDLVDLL